MGVFLKKEKGFMGFGIFQNIKRVVGVFVGMLFLSLSGNLMAKDIHEGDSLDSLDQKVLEVLEQPVSQIFMEMQGGSSDTILLENDVIEDIQGVLDMEGEKILPEDEVIPDIKKSFMIDEIDVKNLYLDEVLKLVEVKTGQSIEWVSDEKIKVSISLTNIEVSDFLRIILDDENLAFVYEDGMYKILTASVFEEKYHYIFGEKLRVQRVRVIHVGVDDLIPVLKKMTSKEGKVYFDERNRSFILIDAKGFLIPMVHLIKDFDVVLKTKKIHLRYIRVADIIGDVKKMLSKSSGFVDSNEVENFIIVKDSLDRVVDIEKFIDNMDFQDQKIIYDVKVLQIILNDENYAGIDWEAIVSEYKSMVFDGSIFQPNEGKLNEMRIGIVSEEDYLVLLDALGTVGRVSTEMDLKIEAKNGGISRFLLNTKDLFSELEKSEDILGRMPISSTGIAVYIKTKLTEKNVIDVGLQVEMVEDIVTERLEEKIEKKMVDSLYSVHPGTTLVLGGVFREMMVSSVHKIPFLGDVPFLGKVFRNEGETMKKTEVIIFMTPKKMADDL